MVRRGQSQKVIAIIGGLIGLLTLTGILWMGFFEPCLVQGKCGKYVTVLVSKLNLPLNLPTEQITP